jgi:hypothetical protein
LAAGIPVPKTIGAEYEQLRVVGIVVTVWVNVAEVLLWFVESPL